MILVHKLITLVKVSLFSFCFRELLDVTPKLTGTCIILLHYYIVDFAIFVTECPANCLQCGDPNNNGVMVCSQCASQFVLNPGDCGACPRYCSNCTFANGALTCNTCGPRSVMQAGNGTCLGKT